ncbi:YesL family protein [Butyrivibrio sp. VCB2006]|uniref:YesL family protein n=1 Tax=Butyrivibrio sp. VCB2006 TaxID=1280679 RepID=UPI00041F3FB0|nr:DUF624 domain-containing protein [Butyrivibrio sp. VCB2006]
MGKIFDIDSPLMHALSKLADVMWLNILTLLFATPLIIEQAVTIGGYLVQIAAGEITNLDGIVFYVVVAWLGGIVCSIPLGPALTAMHYVLLKIVRDEDSYVTKSFFKSFKENFKQGAILQVIQFAAGGILLLDFLIMKDNTGIYRYIVIAIALILYMVSLYIFPLLSKFVNTVLGTLRNAALMSIMALPKTVLMVLVSAVPVVIFYFFYVKALPVLILLGISGPGFVHALLYNGTFKRFEPKVEEMSEEEEMEAAIRKIDDGEVENKEEQGQ